MGTSVPVCALALCWVQYQRSIVELQTLGPENIALDLLYIDFTRMNEWLLNAAEALVKTVLACVQRCARHESVSTLSTQRF